MKTQMQWIIDQLKKRGKITRNQCLRRFISRLGARINELKQEGYQFKTYYQKTRYGQDYIYELKK